MTNETSNSKLVMKTVKQKQRPCPICKKISTTDYFPFCSQGCKELDLNRWLSGSYSIPAATEPTDED